MTIELNKMLQPGGIVPIDIPTTAALVAEVQRLREEVEADNRNLEQLTDEVAQCSKARADLEAEVKRLREALESARGALCGAISKVRENPNLAESTCRHGLHKIDVALKETP